MTMSNQREAFEKWIQTRKLFTQYGAKLRRGSDGGQYTDVRVNGHWMTWQAAQADKLDLLNALKVALDWIDAVPSETVLPAMPGFDRDDVGALIAKVEQEQ
jgi:hypothetical protein